MVSSSCGSCKDSAATVFRASYSICYIHQYSQPFTSVSMLHSSHRFPSEVETPVPVTVMRVCSGLKQKTHTKPSITRSLPPSINLDNGFEVILSN